jgi:UDP-N-acetylmuramoylalanine--D-glutamate ligase
LQKTKNLSEICSLIFLTTIVIMNQKNLVILGGGESGVGAAMLAKAKGYNVFLSDQGQLKEEYRRQLLQENIEFEEGVHSVERVLAADEVIKSPGIPDKVALIQDLYKKGIPVLSEIEFAARYTDARLLAITGSNGKTTTSLLTYHLMKTAGLAVGLAGNIGKSFALQVLKEKFDYYVLEISSFQLDNMYDFHADVAVLLNITPDHLDRYGYQFQNYIDSKMRIIQNQTAVDKFIYFEDSKVILDEFQKRDMKAGLLPVSLEKDLPNGAFLKNGHLSIPTAEGRWEIPVSELPIKGPHNAINAMAAISAALAVGVEQDAILAGLKTFKNAAHRLEPVGEIGGVTYINDSKATNVDSVYYALGSFQVPIVLIAGGVDKGNDYDQIKELVKEKVKGLIALGKDNDKLRSYFGELVPAFYSTDSLSDAVARASEWSVPGDVVILSPACASFDLFKNYEDRGDKFREAVSALAESRRTNNDF